MFKQLVGKLWRGGRATREQWEADLSWFRLRYLTADGPTNCIQLLSRPAACGRVALYFHPDETLSKLYLGIPTPYVRLLHRMAVDFSFSLKPKSPGENIPALQPLTSVAALPWERPFMAHIVEGSAFVSQPIGEQSNPGHRGTGQLWPGATSHMPTKVTNSWHLPAQPPPGITIRPSWPEQAPTSLLATGANSLRWLVGRDKDGSALQVAGSINIYGDVAAVTNWLVYQLSQTVTENHANLVVIDGAGDLVPRLKRKPGVTKLLGKNLAYIDVDGAAVAGGFNPLAKAPNETEGQLVQRWQSWFKGMQVNPASMALLPQARLNGVGDIPTLRKWLLQRERRGEQTAVASLQLALARLTASRSLREWIEWPINRWEILPGGALFFACQATEWNRKQLLHAVLLTASQIANVRLVIHGIPWQTEFYRTDNLPRQTVLSNGPRLINAQPILVRSAATTAQILGGALLNNDPRHIEMLQLLREGEGVIITDSGPLVSNWLVNKFSENSAIC